MRRTIIKTLILSVLFSFISIPSTVTYSQQKNPPAITYNKKLCEWPARLKWKMYKKYWKWKVFKKWKKWKKRCPRWKHRR
jgi:hypothetical protein